MGIRHVLYNSVTVSMPKNVMQFLLGVVIFWIVSGNFSLPAVSMSLLAFLLTYSTVYFYNDIIDSRDDKKDREKLEWKLIANGKAGKKTFAFLGSAFCITGLTLSYLVNVWFFFMMASLLFLNFLHSSPYTRLKKKIWPTAVNMSAIEFIKYSCGWFALTSDLSRFPFWLILTFALFYSGVYLVYKFRFKGDIIRKNRLLFMSFGFATIFSFVASLFFYQFAVPMILLISVTFLMAGASSGKKLKLFNWLMVEFIVLPIVLIAFLLLGVPQVAEANEGISTKLCEYKTDIYKNLPESVAERLKGIDEPKYHSLEEFREAVNDSLMLPFLENTGKKQ